MLAWEVEPGKLLGFVISVPDHLKSSHNEIGERGSRASLSWKKPLKIPPVK